MNNIVIVLSGSIASGKSTLAKTLREQRRVATVSTSSLLRSIAGENADRAALLSLGNDLERQEGAWMGNALRRALTGSAGRIVVLDCVRSASMVDKLRGGGMVDVTIVHVHLTLDYKLRELRAIERGEDSIERADAIGSNAGEDSLLEACADVVLDTGALSQSDVATLAWAYVEQRRGTAYRHRRLVDTVVGGQYGSEGKGHVISRIADQYGALCRVGGPNAGHSVVSPADGRKVSFYHLPSGLLHSDASLVIGPGAVINPDVLEKEMAVARAHGRPVEHRLFIDPNAVIITAENIAAEAALVARIGSTGQGVGDATLGRMRRDGSATLAHTYGPLARMIAPTRELIEDKLATGQRVMMEGTQGTMLSIFHGHYPYVTSRDTAASGTLGEMGIPPGNVDRVIMVCRTNPIRVASPKDGTSGPMGREISWRTVSSRSGILLETLMAREKTTTTKRDRRVAEFNWAELREAALLNRPTDIALTFVDYISEQNANASRFDQLTRETHSFIDRIEMVTGARVSYISTGFGPNTVIVR